MPNDMYGNRKLTPGTKWWTGYPFAELGDPAGKKAPIREVEVISYDQNKYVLVRLPAENGHPEQEAEVKAGYLFWTFEECYEFEHS